MHGSMVGCVPEAKLEPAVALGHRNSSVDHTYTKEN